MQTTLTTHAIPFKTKNLFSQHYFKDILIQTPDWKRDEYENRRTFEEIKKLYLEKKKLLDRLNESQLEEDFIKPILKILGHIYDVQPPILSAFGTFGRPDYAFFTNDEKKDEVKEGKETDYFRSVIAIGEAKSWDENLDRSKREVEKRKPNPSSQINTYLRVSDVRWGILTNGRLWRLYCKETSFNLDSYYEIDLVNLIEHGDTKDFKYFYLLFRGDAFVPDGLGKCFLDNVFAESVRFAKELEEDVKENVYEALKLLVKGFLEHPDNNLSWNGGNIRDIHDNTLILLYRLLFIFYAEARGLLPTENDVYKSISLEFLKKEIAQKIDNRDILLPSSDVYWARLKNLFDLINVGSEARRIPKEQLFVPPYNGRLFDPDMHPFLKDYKVGDSYLAEAINLLARRNKAFVDYQMLGIRQLGSIYEGLLEYKLKIAEEDLIITKEKGKVVYLSVNKAKEREKKIDRVNIVKSGDIYLVTDKGERKATGSYYTPDYIVKYIVENTLGPLVEAMKRDVSDNGGDLIEKLLSIKILDLAMGSGHFLLEVISFLAREIVEALGKQEKVDTIGEEDEITWAKRLVVERCIYGVDINPLAVELAKVSLWLHTVSKDKPLSFLDHHLRCGNSLIGAKIDDVSGVLPNVKIRSKKKEENGKQVQQTIWSRELQETLKSVLSKLAEIEQMPSDTIEQIKQKERVHENIIKMMQRFKEVADVYTSIYFENDVPSDEYIEMLQSISSSDDKWEEVEQRDWFKSAIDIAEEKKFFHWELEFPDIFFEGEKVKENPGFDAVVGNPPYIPFQERDEEDSSYYGSVYDSAYRTYDIYVLFIEKSLKMLRQEGKFGFINPNKFIHSQYGKAIKEFVMSNSYVNGILDFQDAPVFQDAINYPCILLLTKFYKKKAQGIPYISIHTSTDIETAKQINLLIPLDKSFQFLQAWEEASSHFIPLTIKNEVTIPLKALCTNIYEGVRPGYERAYLLTYEEVVTENIERDITRPAVKSERIDPYEVVWFEHGTDSLYIIFPYKWGGSNFVLVDLDEFPNAKRHFEQYKMLLYDNEGKGFPPLRYRYYHCPMEMSQRNRIITPDISNRCEFYLDFEGKFIFPNTIYGISLAEGLDTSAYFILSILNSSLIECLIKAMTPMVRGGYHRFKSEYLEKLPIRRISFTTLSDLRAALFEEAKQLYLKYLITIDHKPMLDFVEARLPKDDEGNFVAEKEQSDVIHDLLAYLAKQMIVLNKSKNEEIRNFLEWLEREIGTKIETLTNRTKLKQYYDFDFDELLGILKKNKKKISITLSNREFQDNLKKEFEKSKVVLSPLRNKIEATDKLIGQIVYKLYGLTDEEIKIVESSLSKDSNENRNEESVNE